MPHGHSACLMHRLRLAIVLAAGMTAIGLPTTKMHPSSSHGFGGWSVVPATYLTPVLSVSTRHSELMCDNLAKSTQDSPRFWYGDGANPCVGTRKSGDSGKCPYTRSNVAIDKSGRRKNLVPPDVCRVRTVTSWHRVWIRSMDADESSHAGTPEDTQHPYHPSLSRGDTGIPSVPAVANGTVQCRRFAQDGMGVVRFSCYRQ